MTVKIIPITEYDFNMFNIFVKNHYGNAVAISPAIFKPEITDKENLKCINCGTLLKNNSHISKDTPISYCTCCGAGVDWSNYEQ
jgi:hypothetical protein